MPMTEYGQLIKMANGTGRTFFIKVTGQKPTANRRQDLGVKQFWSMHLIVASKLPPDGFRAGCIQQEIDDGRSINDDHDARRSARSAWIASAAVSATFVSG